jgi:hypothetical protein
MPSVKINRPFCVTSSDGAILTCPRSCRQEGRRRQLHRCDRLTADHLISFCRAAVQNRTFEVAWRMSALSRTSDSRRLSLEGPQQPQPAIAGSPCPSVRCAGLLLPPQRNREQTTDRIDEWLRDLRILLSSIPRNTRSRVVRQRAALQSRVNLSQIVDHFQGVTPKGGDKKLVATRIRTLLSLLGRTGVAG